jgi:hypothetical protein
MDDSGESVGKNSPARVPHEAERIIDDDYPRGCVGLSSARPHDERIYCISNKHESIVLEVRYLITHVPRPKKAVSSLPSGLSKPRSEDRR